MSIIESLEIPTESATPDATAPVVGSSALPLNGTLAWHESAASRVAQAENWDDGSSGWKAWQKHLAKRRRPRPVSRLFKGPTSALVWSLPAELDSADRDDLNEIVRLADKPRAKSERLAEELPAWLSEAVDAPRQVSHALECLAWCQSLPALAKTLPAALWWELLGQLLALAEEAREASSLPPVVWQLLGAELPLTLAYLFPEIDNCRRLAEPAIRTLTAGVDSLLTTDALPRAESLHLVRPLLACWTRSAAMAQTLPGEIWNEALAGRFETIVHHALRLTRRDGSQVLGAGTDEPGLAESAQRDIAMLRAAARVAGNRRTERIAELVLKGKPLDSAKAKKLPAAAAHSESARLAILKNGWRKGEPSLALTYSPHRLTAELSIGRDLIMSGDWTPEIRRDGQVLAAKSNWEEVCWISNADADYVELEIELAGNVRVQRQIALVRKDQFLIVADAVMAAEPGSLECRSTLPLAAGMEFSGMTDTREGLLLGSKARAMVVPIALPEWRSDQRFGSLDAGAAGLTLVQSRPAARALYAPLFIDLSKRRLIRPVTWRQLTVAENRSTQSADVAVGYRVQVGKQQWLVYRSLAQTGSRTLLGHHLVTEFLIARFTSKGTVDALVEVE